MTHEIINNTDEHDLLFEGFTIAFQDHVQKQLEEAVKRKAEPQAVYQSLRNDCRRFAYHLIKMRKEAVKQARQTLSKETIRAAVLESKRKRISPICST